MGVKIKKFLLNDDTQKNSLQYLDLITFDNEVEYKDIIECIEQAKKIEDYTNEDVYKALDKLGKYTIDWIGGLPLFEY